MHTITEKCFHRFGSHELKKEFLEPSVLGDKVQNTPSISYIAHFTLGAFHKYMVQNTCSISYIAHFNLLSGGLPGSE